MRCIVDVSLPSHRGGEHHRMQRKNVEQCKHTVLVEQHETHQHHATGQHMRDIKGKGIHQKLRDTKSRSMPSNPSIRAMPKKSGTRKTRIFAIERSEERRVGKRGKYR